MRFPAGERMTWGALVLRREVEWWTTVAEAILRGSRVEVSLSGANRIAFIDCYFTQNKPPGTSA